MELPVQLGSTASRPVICGRSLDFSICALNVDVRISLPTRCSIMKSWNTSGEDLNAVRKGDASSALTRSQKPESSAEIGTGFGADHEGHAVRQYRTVGSAHRIGSYIDKARSASGLGGGAFFCPPTRHCLYLAARKYVPLFVPSRQITFSHSLLPASTVGASRSMRRSEPHV